MAVIDIDKAIKDLRALENTEVMTQEQFSSASAAISQLNPKLKELKDGLSNSQKKTFDKRAEKKVSKAQMEHHAKLQS